MSSSRVQTTLTGHARGLRDLHGLGHEVADVGFARRPKPPPRNVVWIFTCSGFKPGIFAAARLVHGLELRARPDLAAVRADSHGAVERLHRRVREVRAARTRPRPSSSRRLRAPRRRRPPPRPSCPALRASARYSSRSPSVSSLRARPRVPVDFERLAPGFAAQKWSATTATPDGHLRRPRARPGPPSPCRRRSP